SMMLGKASILSPGLILLLLQTSHLLLGLEQCLADIGSHGLRLESSHHLQQPLSLCPVADLGRLPPCHLFTERDQGYAGVRVESRPDEVLQLALELLKLDVSIVLEPIGLPFPFSLLIDKFLEVRVREF